LIITPYTAPLITVPDVMLPGEWEPAIEWVSNEIERRIGAKSSLTVDARFAEIVERLLHSTETVWARVSADTAREKSILGSYVSAGWLPRLVSKGAAECLLGEGRSVWVFAEHALASDSGRRLRILTNNLPVASLCSGKDLDVSMLAGRLDSRYAAVIGEVPPEAAQWCNRAASDSHVAFFGSSVFGFDPSQGPLGPYSRNDRAALMAMALEAGATTVLFLTRAAEQQPPQLRQERGWSPVFDESVWSRLCRRSSIALALACKDAQRGEAIQQLLMRFHGLEILDARTIEGMSVVFAGSEILARRIAAP
jgi:hypothetical protein